VTGKYWQRLEIPQFCERLLVFSVPIRDRVLVASYEGMHQIQLNEPVTVSTDLDYFEYDCFDPETGLAEYDGELWNMVGLYPGKPIRQSPQGEELRLDTNQQEISVWQENQRRWFSPFENYSGDWAAATFSPDGNHIVLGCPYDFDFRVWKRLGE